MRNRRGGAQEISVPKLGMCFQVSDALCSSCPDCILGDDDDDCRDLGEQINNYAMFMGYVSMAVRGLGYLVITWTTVVLLGGFVSLLQKKDFWSLTVITLVQTTGVFSVSLKDKLRDLRDSFSGLMVSMCSGKAGICTVDLAVVVATLPQVPVVVLILLPLGVVYMFGLYISTGIALWRLVQRDYIVEADGDPSKANLKAALQVLYVMALLQGALFSYRAIISRRGKATLLNLMYERYHFHGDARRSVSDYFTETIAGCEKDPSFARGRNLVTYAVDLMESRSPESYLSGTRILDSLLTSASSKRWWTRLDTEGRPLRTLVMRQLLGSASATHVIWKLLQSRDSGMSPYGEEVKERAARILGHLASEIALEQFQGQCPGRIIPPAPNSPRECTLSMPRGGPPSSHSPATARMPHSASASTY
ncbi:hypothetical protein ACP70R_046246 [Stipagrostis hirtigluma subsp. patula]